MKINCSIASDLLVLYLDDSCTPESREALEEHLKGCPACREKLCRMQKSYVEPADSRPVPLVSYARKVRRHRICAVILWSVMMLVASLLFALVWLTAADMSRQANLIVHEVEAGTCNLTAGPLETTAQKVENYVLYTNYEQIAVRIQTEEEALGTIKMWNTENEADFIMIRETKGSEEIIFTGLTSANRYRVTCEGLEDASITISEGREVSFWKSLKSVLCEIFGLL